MSPFSPAPCPLRSHRPQLSGREHSAPTLLNQQFSGIWCHSTPPPPSCQGEKSSSLAPAARWDGTDGPCLQERRTAGAWGSASGLDAGQTLRQGRPVRVGRPTYGSLPLPFPLPPQSRRTGHAAAKRGKTATRPSLRRLRGEAAPNAPKGPTRAGLQLGRGEGAFPQAPLGGKTAKRGGQRGGGLLVAPAHRQRTASSVPVSPTPRPNAVGRPPAKSARGRFPGALLDLNLREDERTVSPLPGNTRPVGCTVEGGCNGLALLGHSNCARTAATSILRLDATGARLQKMHRMGFFRRTAGLKFVEKGGIASACPICPTCRVHSRRGETVSPEPSAPCQHYAVPYALA